MTSIAEIGDLQTAKAFVSERRTVKPAELHVILLALTKPEGLELRRFMDELGVRIVGDDRDAI